MGHDPRTQPSKGTSLFENDNDLHLHLRLRYGIGEL